MPSFLARPRFAALIVSSLLGIIFCFFVWRQDAPKAARLINVLKAAGAPLTTKDVAQIYQSQGDVAVAQEYAALFALLPPEENNPVWEMQTPAELASRLPNDRALADGLTICALDEPLTSVTVEKLQAFVRTNESFFEVAEKLTNAGAASFDYDWRLPFERKTVHLNQMYAVAMVIAARCYLNIELGDRDAVIDDIKRLSQIAGALKNEPFLLGHHVRNAIARRELNCLNRLLCQLHMSPDQLKALYELPNISPTAQEYMAALESERALGLDLLNQPAPGQTRRAWNYNQWVYLSTFQSVLSAMERPQNEVVTLLPKIRQNFEARSAPDRRGILRDVLRIQRVKLSEPVVRLSDLFWGWETVLETIARERLARIALAIEIHRSQHRSLPEPLSLLARVEFRDPFTSEQMRFRMLPNNDAWIIYSLGRNQVDDAGEGIQVRPRDPWFDGQDIVFPVSTKNRR